MGKLYSYTYVSLDGVMSSPEAWVSSYWSAEMDEDLARRLKSAAAMVLGRKTYDEFAGFWPRQGSDVPFADLNNRIRKLVVSRTTTEASWQNSSTVSAAALAERKSEGDLHITGSRELVLSLLELQLLDEMVLMLCPVVLGVGQRLFGGANRLGMELAETVRFPNGVLCLKLNPIARSMTTS